MKVCCYARTSTLDQAREEKASIPEQIKWARDLAHEKGWEFTQEYIEPGIRGDIEFEQREAATQLLSDVHPLNHPGRKFDVVLVYHSSRLAREPDLALKFLKILGRDNKVQVYIRNVPIDPVKPEDYYWGGNYIQQVMTAFAGVSDQQENVTRGERVRIGFKGLAEHGKLTFAPYGFKKIPQIVELNGKQTYDWHYEYDPQKASIVKLIFELYGDKAYTLRGIMSYLNDKAIPSPSGNKQLGWSALSVKNLLNNPSYVGYVRWGRKLGSKYKQGRTTTGKQKRTFTTMENQTLVKAINIPKQPLISEPLFTKVQQRLKERGVVNPKVWASEGLLTGILKCGVCGKNCYYKTRKIKKLRKDKSKEYLRSDYLCQTHISKGANACRRFVVSGKKIHDIILKEIDKLITQANKRKKMFSLDKTNKVTTWNEKLTLLKQQENSLVTENKRLLELYTAGKIGITEFGDERNTRDKKITNLQTSIKELEDKINNVHVAQESEAGFTTKLTNFRQQFDKANIKEQKEMLHQLIEAIYYGENGKIDIKYRI